MLLFVVLILFMKWVFLLFLCIHNLTGQNLVPNPSFETHPALNCLDCFMSNNSFGGMMNPWVPLYASRPKICSCKNTLKKEDKRWKNCPVEVKPQDGCTMMEMSYYPGLSDWNINTTAKRVGLGDYLAILLTEPLNLGEIYEVSFWIQITTPQSDSSYSQNIGFNLYSKPIINKYGSILRGSKFLLDSIASRTYNVWQLVKWRLRPMCKLQFLVIGTFMNALGPPSGKDSDNELVRYNRYYIDKVRVAKVIQNSDTTQLITPYCKYTLEESADFLNSMEDIKIYFKSGDSTLTNESKKTLDSFAIFVRNNPKINYLLSGHADALGDNNANLSKVRIDFVKKYLQSKYKISNTKFNCYAAGSTLPAGPNSTIKGRDLNRRVEIKQRLYLREEIIYRQIVEHIQKNEINEARKKLLIWLNITIPKRKLYPIFDPRLIPLRKGVIWQTYLAKIKDSYKDFENPKLSFSLDSLWAEDQRGRTLSLYIENLVAYDKDIDSTNSLWKVDFHIDSISGPKIDSQNLIALFKLIGNRTIPNESEVGQRQSSAVFLIIQHSMDTSIISKYLPIYKSKCIDGESEWMYYALLFDRLELERNRPQRFGTQFRYIQLPDGTKQKKLFKLQDKNRTNEFREKIGLPYLDRTLLNSTI